MNCPNWGTQTAAKFWSAFAKSRKRTRFEARSSTRMRKPCLTASLKNIKRIQKTGLLGKKLKPASANISGGELARHCLQQQTPSAMGPPWHDAARHTL